MCSIVQQLFRRVPPTASPSRTEIQLDMTMLNQWTTSDFNVPGSKYLLVTWAEAIDEWGFAIRDLRFPRAAKMPVGAGMYRYNVILRALQGFDSAGTPAFSEESQTSAQFAAP